jgi:hypothetical protein
MKESESSNVVDWIEFEQGTEYKGATGLEEANRYGKVS